ncbi:asparagine synthase (glutamine-hydrolyzing) [Azospirillum brasilense]|uniref:asparagine synthase (glutamine-hydrolyzing) n=1 Tax=Azospirillum brasilense TaxID=192 RepID=UPI000E69C18E|nr:asparagine synthase (glutamine-hydrolyzing) [Azospirillum brasilense]NUB24907.1 asparagine synthase (glutamine-hydrolyzing) [Azospirillum brasilense]NUB30487.1 asparagine synthase (glutamine-hydrolyzing) [Azospirillum brasilense]RIV97624.1 asparagine synthase (glutamine-hydrolyzing) [Azospirillum brasilense]
MCGLLAVAGPGPVTPATAALDRLAHRGPDGAGAWAAPSGLAWLGHRRLSINDLSPAGNQPLLHAGGGTGDVLALVCNGEIYNAPTLRTELEALGHAFASRSDNEVILHGYRAWGDAVVDRLTGMFAFVLWDDRRRRLLAARDRVGIKPLYWAEPGDGGIAFASEARPLATLPGIGPAVELRALGHALTLGYVPAPLSAWRGIHKLEPGRLLVWEPGQGAALRRYWEAPRSLAAAGDGDAGWAGLFDRAVADHLLSDVPAGLFLSGGLDSAAVATAAVGAGLRPAAYTLCYPGRPDAEAEVAAAVARHLGLEHRLVPAPTDGLADRLAGVAALFDEPQGYSALVTMAGIARAAAAEHKVVLSGDGGDEVLGGYAWYAGLDPDGPPPGAEAGGAHAAFAARSVLHRHAMRLFPRFLPDEVEALFAPAGLRFGEEEMLAPLEAAFEPGLPLRRALQRVDLATFCADSILAKVDRASMAYGLEVRVPFLDHRLVEWGLSRPPAAEEAVHGKPVLRRYLAGRVPERVFGHPKTGFSLKDTGPFDWNAALDRVAAGPLVRHGLLDPGFRRIVEARSPYRQARIWALLALSLWAGSWME